MTPKRIRLFVKLVDELVEYARTAQNGFIPEDAWMALHRLAPMPAMEILLTRSEGRKFLLTYRKDKKNGLEGWHIPGGFMIKRESIAQTCTRVMLRELSVDVAGLRPVALSSWRSHPYGGNPISIIMTGYPVGVVEETEQIRFFSHIPTPMYIPEHVRFLGAYLNYLEGVQRPLVLINNL